MKRKTTAEQLQRLMNAKGWTQSDILRMAQPHCKDLGVKLNKSDLSQYISGKVEPTQKKVMLLATALHVDPLWLMGYEDTPEELIREPEPELSDDERYVIKFRNALNSMDESKKQLMKDNIDTMYKMLGIDPTNL